MIGLDKGLFRFQEDCVEFMLGKISDQQSKKEIKIKAPTGAGKTIMLIGFIEQYIENISNDTAFIWLCPGKGDLEEQSRQKMKKHLPSYDSKRLFESLNTGFTKGSTTFINWELVCKEGNNATRETEHKNIYDRIIEAKNDGTNFILIIDEEHSNNTKKASYILDMFDAIRIIRVSATPRPDRNCEFYEIEESKVIDEGLITKAIYINEGLMQNADVSKDYSYLIDLAEIKQKQIQEEYTRLGRKVRPLVLIQFPSGKPETVKLVEDKLKSMGYTTENEMVAIWLSERKEDIPDNLTENNAKPIYLLMKQAISTGWDCPRAKILVKLREGGTESFQIQTIGRIRRTVEPTIGHYGNELLDYSYIYTLDEVFRKGLMDSFNDAFEKKSIFIKEDFKEFTLIKEIRDNNYKGLGELNILRKIFEYLSEKYALNRKNIDNKTILIDAGYNLDDKITGKTIKGLFIKSDDVVTGDDSKIVNTVFKATAKNAGLQLNHVIHQINSITHMNSRKIRVMLDILFWEKETSYSKYKILKLNTSEYYAFVVNNEDKLVNIFKELASQMNIQLSMLLEPQTQKFMIPYIDTYKYDSESEDNVEFDNNVYFGYTGGFVNKKTRSKSERLFENFCKENSDKIKWFYKNGDVGEHYLSILYLNGFGEQALFYPDYILGLSDDSIMIAETKGGETDGNDNNIDIQIENKFNSLKRYAREYGLRWGFIRDKDGVLMLNNTKYVKSLSDSEWKPLVDVIK